MFKGSRLMKREPFLIETKKEQQSLCMKNTILSYIRLAIFGSEEYYSFF